MKKTLYLSFIISFILNSAIMAGGTFVDLNDKDVEYYTGSNLSYYKEYKGTKYEDHVMSFPLKATDPLPVHTFGSLRLFFTSAVEGHCPRQGEPIMLPDDQELEVRVVRAKAASNGHSAQIYFGYDKKDFKQAGKNKIFKARILAILTKDTRRVENIGLHLFSGATYLQNTDIGQEVKKHLQNESDWNWNSSVFKGVLNRLLPTGEGIFFGEQPQMLLSNTCYWTKDENKLTKKKYKGNM